LVGYIADIITSDAHFTLCRTVQSQNGPEQCCLAYPRRARDCRKPGGRQSHVRPGKENGVTVPDADVLQFHSNFIRTDQSVIRFLTFFFEPFLYHLQMSLCKLSVVEFYTEYFQCIIKLRGQKQRKECCVESDAFEDDDLKPHLKRNQPDAEYRDKLEHQSGLERILQNGHRVFDIPFIERLEPVHHGLSRLCIPHSVLSADQVEE